MNAPQWAAARTMPAGRQPNAMAVKAAEVDGQVIAMGDEFVEEGEQTTDRSISLFDDGPPDSFDDGEDDPTVERVIEQVAERVVEEPRAHARARRATLVSSIPAQLAESMRQIADFSQVAPRDPAAPAAENREITRRVAVDQLGPPSSEPSGRSSAYSVELIDEAGAQHRRIASALIARARACLERGDLGGAVLAADEVMADGEMTKAPGVSDLLEQARPLLDHIFVAYIGLLSEVPVMARSDDDLAGEALDAKTRALIARVDGVLTLEQLFSACHIPAVDAVRIAASLLCSGIIRVV
jgi:hypothetical protein